MKQFILNILNNFIPKNEKDEDINYYSSSKEKIEKDLEENPIDTPIITEKVKAIEDINIIKDSRVMEKYKDITNYSWNHKTRKPEKIKEVVIHGTAGFNKEEWLINWMLGYNGKKAERYEEYKNGIALFHYLISLDGKIIEIVDPNYWCYHSSSGLHDKETLGIELLKPSTKNVNKPTEEQYKALFELTFRYLMKEFKSINRITSHNYNVKKYKNSSRECPGTFDWKRLDKQLKENKYEFKTYYDLRYEIKKIS